MYQAFEAVVSKGRIRPLENIRLREATRLLVAVIPEREAVTANWGALRRWISRQRKAKQSTSHSSVHAAKQHLRKLLKA